MKKEFLTRCYLKNKNQIGGYEYTKKYDYWVEIKNYLDSYGNIQTYMYLYQRQKDTINTQKQYIYIVTKENGQFKFKLNKKQ